MDERNHSEGHSGRHSHVGRRIREVRQALGMTQAQVAEHVGRDASTIGYAERGKAQADQWIFKFVVLAMKRGVAALDLVAPIYHEAVVLEVFGADQGAA